MASTFSTVASFTDATEGKVTQYTTTSTTGGDYVQVVRMQVGFAAEESIAIHADITGGNGPGYVIVKNHDATNFLKFGTVTTVYFAELDPGDGTETMLIPIARGATSLFVRADTGNVDATFEIHERGA